MARSLQHIDIGIQNRSLAFASLMIFFFVLFDGILMYLAPIIMHDHGLTESRIGLIIGLSSIAGMLFDIVLARAIRNATYRSIFLSMLLVATLYPVFLFGANTITVYLIAMAVWGLYYNLYNVGLLDFVSRSENGGRHAHTYGVLKVFDGLGYMIAPLLGSLFLLNFTHDIYTAMLAAAILLPAYFFYLLLIVYKNKKHNLNIGNTENISEKAELNIWKKLIKTIFPILILTFIVNAVDSAIWTIGPIFSESMHGGGYFMLAYTLPPLLAGWLVGRGVSRYGKRLMSYGNLLFGSVFVGLLSYIDSRYFIWLDIFLASLFFSFAWPTINSLYADYIATHRDEHEETESVEDLFTNLGDVSGPILAGFLAESLGIQSAFFYIGFSATLLLLVLYKMKVFERV